MKKKMILAALLAIPLGTLLAEQYGQTPRSTDSSSSMYTMPADGESRMYDQQVVEEYLDNPMYDQQVVEEYIGEEPNTTMYGQKMKDRVGENTYQTSMQTVGNQLSYEQDVVSESKDTTEHMSTKNPTMYEQQVVEEYIDEGANVTSAANKNIVPTTGVTNKSLTPTGMTPEQRTAHAELMKEIKQTGAKKPSQIAAKRKTATKKTATKKTTTPAKKGTTKDTKSTTPKKTTSKTTGKKVASTKTSKSGGKQTKMTKKQTAESDTGKLNK